MLIYFTQDKLLNKYQWFQLLKAHLRKSIIALWFYLKIRRNIMIEEDGYEPSVTKVKDCSKKWKWYSIKVMWKHIFIDFCSIPVHKERLQSDWWFSHCIHFSTYWISVAFLVFYLDCNAIKLERNFWEINYCKKDKRKC